MAAARGKVSRLMEWDVWSWPKGLPLPTGTLRDGVMSPPVLPAERALLDFAGTIWRVNQWPIDAFLNPPPDWLISALQEFA
jgi:hypothetical protein